MVPAILLAVLIAGIPSVLGAQSPSTRQAFDRLDPQEQTLVSTWLEQDCSVQERRHLLDRVEGLGKKLEPVFWEAYRDGPPDRAVERLQGQLAARYAERQSRLRQIGPDLFGKEETTQLLTLSPTEFVQRGLAQFQQRYRSAALSGLGLVGTDRQPLEDIAHDVSSPLAIAAQEALRTMSDHPQH